jgi:hypothetical protein
MPTLKSIGDRVLSRIPDGISLVRRGAQPEPRQARADTGAAVPPWGALLPFFGAAAPPQLVIANRSPRRRNWCDRHVSAGLGARLHVP